MAVDLDQSVDHPLVLFTVGVGIVLQHQPGLGHPDWIGEGEREDAWLTRLGATGRYHSILCTTALMLFTGNRKCDLSNEKSRKKSLDLIM